MPTIDLSFPAEVRTVLAELGHMLADAAPAAILALTDVPDDDADLSDLWLASLHSRIDDDTAAVLRLLDRPAFGTGPVEIDDDEALAALRGFTTLRVTLRETALAALPDDALETGKIDRRKLKAAQRHAYACYAALGEIQSALCELLDL